MKTRWLLLVGIFLGGTVAAWADDANTSSPIKTEAFFGTPASSAVLNNPGGALGTAKETINTVQPGLETLYDIHHGSWHLGTSAALYTLTSKSFPLASLRAGYAPDALVYGEMQLDGEGLTKRFVLPYLPGTASSLLTAGGALDGVWGLVRKYGMVGAWGGYEFRQSGGLEFGIGLGGKVSF